ncbi:2'-5' RNA ligase family protein [Pararcticibacter amylolyticus]|uniref:2'-5' RNA ligase n=1 Tax=Pararcticibacter amylolyticus TaxID=2173175 RepID=A0A2U2PJH5_9SPHI|nr:2'-5' RNA ligase family protein [Pararcticibacter amylolyticus]PWG81412.1 hypothetical protein DDR33_06135 [Pararcticibacter amylolyticus]
MSLYLTAILPPPSLAEEIDEIRKEISERFKVYKALKPPVHITLFHPVSIQDELEKYLVKWLKPVTLLHDKFEISLQNYDSFNNQTVYIDVVKNEFLGALQKDIASVYNKNRIEKKEVKSNNRFKPHLTVAYRDLSPETFSNLWPEFKDRKFKRKFTADRFTLLKHDTQRWNILEEFRLNKPETYSLFP